MSPRGARAAARTGRAGDHERRMVGTAGRRLPAFGARLYRGPRSRAPGEMSVVGRARAGRAGDHERRMVGAAGRRLPAFGARLYRGPRSRAPREVSVVGRARTGRAGDHERRMVRAAEKLLSLTGRGRAAMRSDDDGCGPPGAGVGTGAGVAGRRVAPWAGSQRPAGSRRKARRRTAAIAGGRHHGALWPRRCGGCGRAGGGRRCGASAAVRSPRAGGVSNPHRPRPASGRHASAGQSHPAPSRRAQPALHLPIAANAPAAPKAFRRYSHEWQHLVQMPSSRPCRSRPCRRIMAAPYPRGSPEDH